MRSKSERDVPRLLREKWDDPKVSNDEIAMALGSIFVEARDVEQYQFLKKSIRSFTHERADPRIELSLVRRYSQAEEFERGLDLIDGLRSDSDRFKYVGDLSIELGLSVNVKDDIKDKLLLRFLPHVIEVLRETPSDFPLIDDDKMDDLIWTAGRFRRAVFDTISPIYRTIVY